MNGLLLIFHQIYDLSFHVVCVRSGHDCAARRTGRTPSAFSSQPNVNHEDVPLEAPYFKESVQGRGIRDVESLFYQLLH